MKRLALFLDGTWNDPGDNTNVWRLKLLTASHSGDGVEQLSYYGRGVGTRRNERLRGGILGSGVSRNIRDAYEWLMEHYDEGDQIFLFGFSRGAYTARSVAGLIARCGLLLPGAPLTVADQFDRYRRHESVKPLHQLEFERSNGRSDFSVEDRTLLRHSRRVGIEFIGVWDTVGALGVPFGRIRGLSRNTFRFHNTNPSVLYKAIYQALALDEHRAAYVPTLWTTFQPTGAPLTPISTNQVVEQRWFIGAHSNVGGGYSADPLSQIPMAWMQNMAAERGLAFRRSMDPDDDALNPKPNDSFAEMAFGLYRLIRLNRRHYRTIGREPRPTSSRPGLSHILNETIDHSVFDKWRLDGAYRPRNLAEWAKRLGINPANVFDSMPARGSGLKHGQTR